MQALFNFFLGCCYRSSYRGFPYTRPGRAASTKPLILLDRMRVSGRVSRSRHRPDTAWSAGPGRKRKCGGWAVLGAFLPLRRDNSWTAKGPPTARKKGFGCCASAALAHSALARLSDPVSVPKPELANGRNASIPQQSRSARQRPALR